MNEKYGICLAFVCCFWISTSHAQGNHQWMCSVDYWSLKTTSPSLDFYDCSFSQNNGCKDDSKLSVSNGYVFFGDREPAKIGGNNGRRLWAERKSESIFDFYNLNKENGVLIRETGVAHEGYLLTSANLYKCTEIK